MVWCSVRKLGYLRILRKKRRFEGIRGVVVVFRDFKGCYMEEIFLGLVCSSYTWYI